MGKQNQREVRSPPTRVERREIRQKLGPLRSLLVSPKTLSRYKNAVLCFFALLKANDMSHGRNPIEVDLHVSIYIESLWDEGESRSLATDCLSGLQMFLPCLKRNMFGAWRLVTAWQKHELLCRAPPLLPLFVLAMAGQARKEGNLRFGICLLLGFHCLLRTIEILHVTCQDILFSDNLNSAILQLPNTKSQQRTGNAESVTVTDSHLVKLLFSLVRHREPGDSLLDLSAAQFRAYFQKLCVSTALPDAAWQPYSLRRGGATADFRAYGKLDSTMVRGRWSNQRTCRIYINDAMSMLPLLTVSAKDQERLEKLGTLMGGG